MKNWEFQCPKCAFVELIQEYQRIIPSRSHITHQEIDEFVEKFLQERFQDYFPD